VHAGDEIVFLYEKLFLLQEAHSPQNNRMWAVLFASAASNKLVARFQYMFWVMIWDVVSKICKMTLLFTDRGGKINPDY
jgi:hypothetical protein